MTTSWPTWIQLEQYSALHNLPFASKDDGFEGLDAQLEINSRAHVKHIERLLDMAKEGRSSTPAVTTHRTSCWCQAMPASTSTRRPRAATW